MTAQNPHVITAENQPLSEVSTLDLHVNARATYELPSPMTTLLQIEVAHLPLQQVISEKMTFSPPMRTEQFFDMFGNRNRRFDAPQGRFTIDYEATVRVPPYIPLASPSLTVVPLSEIPPDVLMLTMPSRYCESDRLGQVVADLFGEGSPNAQRVFDICDWIRSRVTYEYGHTNSGTSAFDTVTERIGVCRDFSHLAIAFCRALNIPARYAAGYCLELDPPDFHAYFQAYLAAPPEVTDVPGWWYTFDATYERVRCGLVNTGVGRDAVDTAMATFYGNATLLEQTIKVEKI